MRTRTHLILIVAALLGGGTARVSGQNPVSPSLDARWIAYLGCWQQVESAKSQLCVVPAGASAVELLTIAKGQIVSRERVDASGTRVSGARGDCSTWQSAEWSTIAARLYLRSGDKCATGSHSGTAVIAMGTNGEWSYVRGVTLGGQTGVLVERYREAASDLVVPSDVTDALRQKFSGITEARAAAAVPLGIEDVIDASQHVDAAVLEAWLVERGERIPVDAKRLVALADARVPSGVIDVLVALSYPKVFAINPMSRQSERLARAPGAANVTGATTYAMFPTSSLCSSFYPLYLYQSLYDCGYYGGYGYPYDNAYTVGFYPGYYPGIVYTGGGGSQGHGRMVNGHGYQGSGGGSNGNVAEPRRGETGWSTSNGAATNSSSSGSTTGSSSGSSSSSGGEQRTAHPRPPQ